MAELIRSVVVNVLSLKCYEKYFIESDFFDVVCFKILLSKALGYGIILGSILVKLPQIIKILSNKSAQGINLIGVLLEITAITISLSYSYVNGFPFSSWGDVCFLALQTAVIACLVLFFSGALLQVALFIVVYSSVCYVLMSGLTSIQILSLLVQLNIPIMIAGKLSQAWTNYKNGSTGQLSAITCFMLFFGSMARIFTSVQETGDSLLILTYVVSTLSNGVIVSQLLWYWNAVTEVKKQPAVSAAVAAKAKATKAHKPKSKKAD